MNIGCAGLAAAAAVFLLAAPGAPRAEDVVVADRTLALNIPDGYCELDPSNPLEAMTLNLTRDMQKGMNELLAHWVDCGTLAAYRAGLGTDLAPYILVLASAPGGHVAALPPSITREQFLDLAQQGMGQVGAAIREGDGKHDKLSEMFNKKLDDWSKKNDLDLEVASLQFLELMDRTEDAIYYGLLQTIVANGEPLMVAAVSGIALVRNLTIVVAAYDFYEGDKAIYDTLQSRAAAMTRRILIDNGEKAKGA